MLQNKFKFLLKTVFPVVLFLLSLVVCLNNYQPGTYLIGWDNLLPEYNWRLNIARSLSATWQEYQGLGLLGGNAHAADLPRQIFLALASAVVPIQFIRYGWTFLMLTIGPLGAYFLAKKILGESNLLTGASAFVAGLFYLLNLATLQTFFTPFETFIGFYGFFPWLLFLSLGYLSGGRKKWLVALALVSIMATTAFYVQTMFVVFIAILIPFVINSIVSAKQEGVRRSIKLLIVIFLLNSFWLLPVLYFSLTAPGVVAASKINSFATPETELMNRGFGNLANIALLKGFWFNYLDLAGDGKFNYLLGFWRDYTSYALVALAGYFVFALSLVGIIWASLTKSFKWRLALPVTFVGVYLMLASTNPPFGLFFRFLSDQIPFFANIFRSVFTKWSVAMALIYGIGLALFVNLMGKTVKGKIVGFLLSAFISLAIVISAFPVFQGKLIMDSARIKVPNAYFELFDYLENAPKETRIAFYPLQTFWGWNFYEWGYRGSGFLWYGIKQPILDRAFDVWSLGNEAFFNEAVSAVYANDKESLKRVFDKYGVGMVLIDKSVLFPGHSQAELRFEETQALLTGIGAQKVWEKDFISLYTLPNKPSNFISSPKRISNVRIGAVYPKKDAVYALEGDYVETARGSSQPTSFYPLAALFSEKLDGVGYRSLPNGQIEAEINRQLSGVPADSKLNIPALLPGTEYRVGALATYEEGRLTVKFDSYAKIYLNGEETVVPGLPDLYMTVRGNYPSLLVGLGEDVYEVKQGSQTYIPRLRLRVNEPVNLYVYDPTNESKINTSSDFNVSQVKKCWTRPGQTDLLQVSQNDGVKSITVKDAAGCIDFKVGSFTGKSLLSIALPYRSSQGARPSFCLVEENSPGKCLHDEIFYHSLVSSDWTKVTRQIVLPATNNYWLGIAAKPSDTPQEEWQIDYENPDISVFPLLVSFSFNKTIWTDLTGPREISLPKGDNVALKVVMTPPREVIDLAAYGRFKIDNCDIFDRGMVAKTLDGGELTYRAKDAGSACDFVILDKISPHDAYIIRFKGKGVSGRGLKFYLFNPQTKHADIETLLPKGNFDVSYSILPGEIDSGEYTLNLENRAFAGELAQNSLSQVEIYGLPLGWLAGWKVGPVRETAKTNEVAVSSVIKKGTFHYSFKTESEEGGVISLLQGFDPGWAAYADGKRLEHARFNNWANAWLIGPGSHKVTLIYRPQYLEFAGFILLIGGIIFAIGFGSQTIDKEEEA